MKNKKISVILNILIVLFEIIGFSKAINSNGLSVFIYYTQDSNLLLLISSFIYLFYLIKNIKIPKWLETLKYTATLSVLITFIVVIFVLSWTTNLGIINLLFKHAMLYHHTLCPIIGIITFTFFEKYTLNTKREIFRTNSFTFLYAFVLTILNVLKVVTGPYPFLMVYNQSIIISLLWAFIILGISIILSQLLFKANGKYCLIKK